MQLLKIGIPSAATTLLLDFSHTYLNANMAAYGDFHIAALGIENKIERLSNSVNLGIAQAMLPLVAFNYSAGNEKRTRGFIRTARIAGFCVSIFSILFYQSMARPLVTLFIKTRGGSADVSATIALAITYLRIRCFAAPVSMLNYVAVNGFQAMGDGKLSLAHSIFKQIVLYFPLMVVLNHFFGVTGLILALPITEAVSSVVATVLIQKKLNRASKEGHFNKNS